jgi:hypothetical protein
MPTLQGQAAGKATIEVATERARLPGKRLILGHRHAARTDTQLVRLEHVSETKDAIAKALIDSPSAAEDGGPGGRLTE